MVPFGERKLFRVTMKFMLKRKKVTTVTQQIACRPRVGNLKQTRNYPTNMMYPLTSCQTNSVADESCPQFSGNEGNVFESRKFEPDRYPFSRNATHNNDVFMISKLQTTNKNMLQQKWWSSSQKSWTKTFFGFMNHWLFSQAWWEFWTPRKGSYQLPGSPWVYRCRCSDVHYDFGPFKGPVTLRTGLRTNVKWCKLSPWILHL